jgi:hypothetical protein
MAFESMRSYIQLASGLGEMTRARAMEAAQGLLSLPGADEVTRRAVRASTLADQLLEAAKANRASLLALVQHEVEVALKRAEVARVADVRAAQVTVSALAREIADLRGMLRAGGAVVGGRSGAVSTTVSSAVPGDAPSAAGSATTTRGRAAKATPAKRAATKTTKKTAAKKSAANRSTAAKGAAKKTVARKSAAKTAATRTPTRRSGTTTTKKANP